MGGEIRVNSYQNNWQRNSHITTFADGSFLVVWDSYFNNYDDGPTLTYVAGQRFRADGTRIGSEFVIDGFDGCSSEDARVATLRDGGYVVVWEFDDYDDILTLDTEIFGQVFNADGSERGNRFRVDSVPSTQANGVLPDVAARGDGGFQVTWGDDNSPGIEFYNLRTRSYDAQGRAAGPDTLLNTNVRDFDQAHARTCTLRDGRVVAIWGSEATISNGGSGNNDIRASILGPDGRVLRGDFHLMVTVGSAGTETNWGYDVAPLANGGFVMCGVDWSFRVPGGTLDYGAFVLMSIYDANGNVVAHRLPVIETDEVLFNARITQLATGEIVVAWVQYGAAPGEVGRDVMARVFTADGRPMSPAFEIGIDADAYDTQEGVEIAALPGGGFVVTYDSESIDIDHEGIAARIYGRGTAGNDVLAVDQTQTMAGLGGDDRISGNARDNQISGGAGNDQLTDAAGGNDRLLGGIGDDRIWAAAGNDTLGGDAGQDTLLAGAGNDQLNGGAGNDLLDGGAGTDTAIYSGATPVRVSLALTGPQATGAGVDRLTGIENLTGGSGADGLYGNGLANVLAGGGGQRPSRRRRRRRCAARIGRARPDAGGRRRRHVPVRGGGRQRDRGGGRHHPGLRARAGPPLAARAGRRPRHGGRPGFRLGRHGRAGAWRLVCRGKGRHHSVAGPER